MKSIYDMIVEINNCKIDGVWFDYIKGYPLVGDILSNAGEHPIEYTAYSTLRSCDDDPFEGTGWTPREAIRNLLKQIKKYE